MRPIIVSGPVYPALAEDVARELECEIGASDVRRFPDGEPDVELRASVRGQPVYVVQPLRDPVGENLLDLLLLADACRRAGASSVSAVAPYVGLARQDRIAKEGRALGAKVLADVLGTARISLLVAVDLHSPVLASCIEAPVVHLTAVPVLTEALRSHVREESVVVAPDLGAVKLAESYAHLLGLPLALVSKTRVSPEQVAVRAVVGEVRGRRPIVVDDMISTGATVDAAVDALVANGCRAEIVVAATHGLFAGGAADRLDRPEVEAVLTTDTLPPAPRVPARLARIRVAPVLAEAIRRIVVGRGLDDLLAAR